MKNFRLRKPLTDKHPEFYFYYAYARNAKAAANKLTKATKMKVRPQDVKVVVDTSTFWNKCVENWADKTSDLVEMRIH